MNRDNYVPIEQLKKFKEFYDNQEGRKFPCSNQYVRCGIITQDKEKAISFMANKNVVKKIVHKCFIEWTLDNNEIWIWSEWGKPVNGCRFYKVAVDVDIDKNIFDFVRPCCANYCCSVELI